MKELTRNPMRTEGKAAIYCYMCTHTVEAEVVSERRTSRVKPGQKCPRCGSALDSGYVIRLSQAA